jgi:leader peptidase (prepilin peptidase)/N-methyltransferase
VADIALGAGIRWLIRFVGTIVFKKEEMGLGDVKLLAMIGGFVGWQGVLLTLVLASFAGAIIGIIVKLITSEAYIPFGPFLVLGATPVILVRPEIMYFVTVTYPRWAAQLFR